MHPDRRELHSVYTFFALKQWIATTMTGGLSRNFTKKVEKTGARLQARGAGKTRNSGAWLQSSKKNKSL
jgi:hypothetical protein